MKFNLLYLLTFVALVAASAIPGPKAVDNDVSANHPLARDDFVCHSSTDCEGGLCWEGICIDSRCRHSGDCPDDYYCFRGNCLKIPGRERDVKRDASDKHLLERSDVQCRHNGNCPDDYYCFRGNCLKIPGRERDVKTDVSGKHLLERSDVQCRHNGNCPDDYYCFRGNCLKIPRWERDVDTVEEVQDNQSDDTVDADMCPIDGIDTNLEAPPTPCKHDKDCKRCMHCIKGQCGYRHGKADDESELMESGGK